MGDLNVNLTIECLTVLFVITPASFAANRFADVAGSLFCVDCSALLRDVAGCAVDELLAEDVGMDDELEEDVEELDAVLIVGTVDDVDDSLELLVSRGNPGRMESFEVLGASEDVAAASVLVGIVELLGSADEENVLVDPDADVDVDDGGDDDDDVDERLVLEDVSRSHAEVDPDK